MIMYPNKPPIKELTKFGNRVVFKFGSNDFNKPITIRRYVNSFGIIKCFKSIKKIITKQILNIKKRRVVNEIPKKWKINTKFIADINSTKKYLILILVEQSLHFAFKNKYENNGMLSCHLICALQVGQWDLPVTTLILSGILWIHTLLKLPHILPKINVIRYNTTYNLILEDNSMMPSRQYCTSIIASVRCK